jgi:hypothetical protein
MVVVFHPEAGWTRSDATTPGSCQQSSLRQELEPFPLSERSLLQIAMGFWHTGQSACAVALILAASFPLSAACLAYLSSPQNMRSAPALLRPQNSRRAVAPATSATRGRFCNKALVMPGRYQRLEFPAGLCQTPKQSRRGCSGLEMVSAKETGEVVQSASQRLVCSPLHE